MYWALGPPSLPLIENRTNKRRYHFVLINFVNFPTERYRTRYIIHHNCRERKRVVEREGEMGERRVGVAMDFSACSKKALKWALDNVVRKGDHLILVTIRPEGHYEEGEMQLWETTGTPLIPLIEFSDPHTMKKYGVTPDPETLDIVSTAAAQKETSVLMKIYWGDAREKLCEAVDKIPLDCLIIGNRGLGKIKRAILGSVSNYVVNNATCPVTVVKNVEHE